MSRFQRLMYRMESQAFGDVVFLLCFGGIVLAGVLGLVIMVFIFLGLAGYL